MEKLKQYVDSGTVELAKLDSQNQPQKIPYSELASQVARQDKNTKLYKSLAALSWDQKYEWVSLKRLKAKEKYQEGLYDEAIEIYLEALVGVDLGDRGVGRVEQMRNQLQLPITLNIITCMYMKKQYKKALALCDKLLSEAPGHLPALYKKVYLLKCCGEYAQAKQLLNQGIKMAKQSNQEQELKSFIQLYGELMKMAKESKSVYAKMFGRESGLEKERESQDSGLLSTQRSSSKSESESEEEVLYYEQQNICNRIHKKIKNLLHSLIPSLKPEKPPRKSLNQSRSL